MKYRMGLLTLALVTIAGCASAYKSSTSGQIGCREDDIQIENLSQGMVTTTWEATCKGKRFMCTQSKGSLGGRETQTTCKEAL